MSALLKRATTGVTGALPYDPVEYCILAAGTAIAWAYTIELDLLIFYTFRRRKGLYFWALLVSSWGCTLHALGFILKFLVGSSWLVDLPFIEIGENSASAKKEYASDSNQRVGWVAMVTGQAFVLYSRLHLVVRNRRTLRLVLAMIIFDAVALHLPTIVFTYGSNSPDADAWVDKFNVMERIQLTGFCVQEFVISTIYIVATVRLLGSIYHSMTRTVMIQLLAINCICIGMDIILIILEFTNNYVGEASVKPMIYAIKLKLEFAVLNQLMGLTKAGFTEENHWRGNDNAHELRHNHTVASSTADPEAAATSPRKQDSWSTARAMRGSLSGVAAQAGISHPAHIFQTKQIEVSRAPKSPSNANVSQSSTLTAVTTGMPSNKANSLMGTNVVRVPSKTTVDAGRNSRRSRHLDVDPEGREQSPVSESEAGLNRRSQDSEKDGTRWIDGLES